MTPEPRSARGGALWDALSVERDIAALVAFRVALGAIALVSALRFLGYGWIDALYVAPRLHLSYWGFAWIPAPSAAVTYALFAAMAVLGALVAVGLFYRFATAALFLVFTYLQLVDVTTYLNHYYLVSLLTGLMFLVPAHRAYSLDAVRRPSLRAATLPAWCTYLLRFQVAVVYFNAGLAKATSDWLLHAQPMNIWLSARTGLPVIGPYLDLPAVGYAAAWAGFLFDATIVLFLLHRRTRLPAYVAVLGFHLMTHLLFPLIGMFPVIMVVAASLFFDADWPRRVGATARRWLVRPPARAGGGAGTPARPLGTPQVQRHANRRWTLVRAGAAGLFMLVQVVLPLRTHFYGGNVLWHEQGMRFSWRVMTRAKNGSVSFVVRDPASGRQWFVSPSSYLTPAQEREMAVQPDLILQTAHHIAREFARDGHPGVEVRAEARASLNGRRAELLVDPTIDLARQRDGLRPKPWITRAPEAEPPRLRSAEREQRNL